MMKLPLLVSQDRWQDFDDAWQEHIKEDGPIEELLLAVKLAGSKKRMSSRGKQAQMHAASLAEAGRLADAASLLGATLVAGGNPADLTNDLLSLSQEAWGNEPWYPAYTELAGLQQGAAELRTPWKIFSKLLRFQPEALVHHPGGWGAGQILSVDTALMEMRVRFGNGREDDFPLHAAVEIFQPLNNTDLRGKHYLDPEGVKANDRGHPERPNEHRHRRQRLVGVVAQGPQTGREL